MPCSLIYGALFDMRAIAIKPLAHTSEHGFDSAGCTSGRDWTITTTSSSRNWTLCASSLATAAAIIRSSSAASEATMVTAAAMQQQLVLGEVQMQIKTAKDISSSSRSGGPEQCQQWEGHDSKEDNNGSLGLPVLHLHQPVVRSSRCSARLSRCLCCCRTAAALQSLEVRVIMTVSHGGERAA